jgi:hypothetical protein
LIGLTTFRGSIGHEPFSSLKLFAKIFIDSSWLPAQPMDVPEGIKLTIESRKEIENENDDDDEDDWFREREELLYFR